MIGEVGVLEDGRYGVEPETVHAQVEPETHHVPHGPLDFGVAPVEVRLLLQKTMIIVLPRRRVQLPGRATETGGPVVRETVASPIAPDVPVTFRIVAA